MEIYTIEKDIRVICVTAESFPDKVMAAHKKLHEVVAQNNNRKFFGISRPGKDGIIIYKAASEVFTEADAEKRLEAFTIKKGKYISLFIPDFCNDVTSVGRAFQELLKYPDIDHNNGYCLEIYETEVDVRCLVPLNN